MLEQLEEMSFLDGFGLSDIRQEVRRLDAEFRQHNDLQKGVIDQIRELQDENRRLSADLRSTAYKVDYLTAELNQLREDRRARERRIDDLEKAVSVHVRLMRSSGKIIEQHTGQLASTDAAINQIKGEQSRLAKQAEIDNDEARNTALALHDQIAGLRTTVGLDRSDSKTEVHSR